MSPACVTDFWDRIQRGNNVTKIGNATNPRDVASQIAAQARAAVDCPTLQCVGPQSTNQGLKAVAIARTYLQQSDQSGASCHPDIVMCVRLFAQSVCRSPFWARLASLVRRYTPSPSSSPVQVP
jgi:stage V sporulation protein SpoVS